MPRNRFMLIAVVLVVMGTIGGLIALKMGKGTPPPPEQFKHVIATQDIPPHIKLTAAMVKVENTTEDPGPAPRATEEAVDLISLKQIRKGEALSFETVAREETGSGSAARFVVPDGKRALAILVDPNTGIGGLVAAGDYVDMLVFYREGEDSIARTVAQDLQVLATEETVAPVRVAAPAPEDDPSKAKSKTPEAPPPAEPKKQIRIIVATTLQEAQALTAADDKGDLVTLLRNPQRHDVLAQLPEAWEHPVRGRMIFSRLAAGKASEAGAPRPSMPTTFPPVTPVGGKLEFPKPPDVVDIRIIRGSATENLTVPR